MKWNPHVYKNNKPLIYKHLYNINDISFVFSYFHSPQQTLQFTQLKKEPSTNMSHKGFL